MTASHANKTSLRARAGKLLAAEGNLLKVERELQ